MWRLPNGKEFRTPKPVTLDGIQYPAQIFRMWSRKDLREKLNIRPIQEVSYNKRWLKSTGYTDELSEDGKVIVRTHTTQPKRTLAEMKALLRTRNKHAYMGRLKRANEMIDYYNATQQTNKEALWQQYKDGMRVRAKNVRNAINGAETYNQLKNVDVGLPAEPESIEEV